MIQKPYKATLYIVSIIVGWRTGASQAIIKNKNKN